jgi:hypothetical protein
MVRPIYADKEKNIYKSYNYLFYEIGKTFMEGVGSIYYTYMYNKTGSCTAYLTICPEAAEDGPFSSFKSWRKRISTLSNKLLLRSTNPQSNV